jgi:hypothetical protein
MRLAEIGECVGSPSRGTNETVAIFRTVVYDRVNGVIAETRDRLAFATLVVVGHADDRSRLDPEIAAACGWIQTAGQRFSLVEGGIATARELRRRRVGRAVIPVRVESRSEAVADYANVLAICAVARIRAITFRTHGGEWIDCGWGSIVVELVRALALCALAPLLVLAGLIRIACAASPRGDPIVSFSGEPNDWNCHLAKANWARRTGHFGVSFQCYLGNPYSLTYPPLSIGLVRWLGVKGITLAVLLGYVGVVAAFAVLDRNIVTAAAGAYLLGSPIFRSALLRFGRPEVLGWLFALGAALFAGHGQPVPMAAMLLLALYTHQFSGTLGVVATALMALQKGVPMAPILTGLATAGMLALPWWVPFFYHSSKLGFWRFRQAVPEFGLRKQDLSLATAIWVAFGFASVLLAQKLTTLHLGLVFVATLGGYMLVRGRYLVHPFSVELALAHLALLVVSVAPGWPVCAAFVIALFGVATYGSRAGFAVRPTYVGDSVRGALELVGHLPEGARVAFEFAEGWNVETDWGWLLGYALSHQDRVEMLSGVAMDQVEAVLPLEYECTVNLKDGLDRLHARMQRVGVTHVAAFTAAMKDGLRRSEWMWVHSTSIPGAARRGPRTYDLYEVPGAVGVMTPAAEVSRGKNCIEFKLPRGEYLLRYAYVSAWTARDELGHPVKIEDAEPGMRMNVRGGRIRLQWTMW